MKAYPDLFTIFLLYIFLGVRTQAQPETNSGAEKKVGAPTIIVAGLEVNDEALTLRYEIKNSSEHDIWICDDINRNRKTHYEVYLDDDAQTLVIRRRLDVPLIPQTTQPVGLYVRLPANGSRIESVLIPLPVHWMTLLSSRGQTQDTVYAVRLLLEIGYYTGDLPGMIRDILEKAENITDKSKDKELANIRRHMGSSFFFNERNERLSQRDEQVMVAYTWQALKGEHVLSSTVEGQRIPYIGRRERYPGYTPPDLSPCTRVEIQYQPSMLEYFFPYAGQQSLLNPEEKKYLQSEKLTVVDDPEDLKDLANEVSKQINSIGGIVCERSNAKVVCYRDDERLTSLTVYDDTTIETERKQRIKYRRVLQSLRKLTPHIQPLELRMQCAANLKNLYHRFLLYHKAQEVRPMDLPLKYYWKYRWERFRFYQKAEKAYPAPTKWCDAMEWAYGIAGIFGESFERAFRCASVSEGKCHYSMNPNCKPDSLPDTVLLFETEAGWNQHGGPELFTFDNHEPKGGCVLLNDGTVKFIRTKEELQQLRWK